VDPRLDIVGSTVNLLIRVDGRNLLAHAMDQYLTF
jgi:hypothetical protein